jgi:hypothetical protein
VQHAACTGAQQIGDHTGYLDVGFLEERFQPVVELDAAARDLVLAAHHGPAEPLLGVGHEAQRELLGHEAFDQTFRIRKVFLAAASPTIRRGLGKMERPRYRARVCARPALRPPVQLQRLPDRPPILRGRFHHDFLDLALDEPVSKRAQFAGAGADFVALEPTHFMRAPCERRSRLVSSHQISSHSIALTGRSPVIDMHRFGWH